MLRKIQNNELQFEICCICDKDNFAKKNIFQKILSFKSMVSIQECIVFKNARTIYIGIYKI